MSKQTRRSGLTTVAKLRLALLTLALTIVLGMLGFMYLEQMRPLDSLYMTVITLSTVGFSEVHPLHDSGRVFVVFLITFGVVQFAAIATLLGQTVLEGQFRELMSRKKMEQKLRKLSNHFIIAGFGRVGRQVAAEFSRRKAPYVVIDTDLPTLERCELDDFTYLLGDATDEETLLKAGIERASTLISTLPDEAQNVYLTLTARHMNPDLYIIARADFEEGEKKLKRAGADHVVIPHVLGGIRMAMASLQPHVVDFVQMTSLGKEGLVVEELTVPEKSFLVERTLAESQLKPKYGITVIGVKPVGGRMIISPGPEVRLQPGDIVVIIGSVTGLEQLSRDLNGHR